MQYEIRRFGEVVCVSSLPKCGYSERVFRDMIEAGYEYYAGGKLNRKAGA